MIQIEFVHSMLFLLENYTSLENIANQGALGFVYYTDLFVLYWLMVTCKEYLYCTNTWVNTRKWTLIVRSEVPLGAILFEKLILSLSSQ